MHPSVPGISIARAIGLQRTCIVIPARLASKRFPNKPLVMIQGKPLIQHAVECAEATGLPVFVTTPDQAIVDAVARLTTASLVMTPPDLDLRSGSDRVAHAMGVVDAPGKYHTVINFQGDIPFIAPESICGAVLALRPGFDLGTLVGPLAPGEMEDPNVVKAVMVNRRSGAIDFVREVGLSRAGEGYYYQHHIGVYAFSRSALEKHARLPMAPTEIERSLEQLRLMWDGWQVGTYYVTPAPISINVPTDLMRMGISLLEFWQG